MGRQRLPPKQPHPALTHLCYPLSFPPAASYHFATVATAFAPRSKSLSLNQPETHQPLASILLPQTNRSTAITKSCRSPAGTSHITGKIPSSRTPTRPATSCTLWERP